MVSTFYLLLTNLKPKFQTAFADGYPFLILSQESLSDLNKRLSSPVAMRNFRPNIVIKGCKKPYEEDTWKQIRIGPDHSNDHLFFLVARCTRCVSMYITYNQIYYNMSQVEVN